MSALEMELERRLEALPDAYPGFTRITMAFLEDYGLAEEVIKMLDETPRATARMVTRFECEYRGVIELFDESGERKPAEVGRLRFTSGMREILAELKGKTLKSYERVASGDRGMWRSDGLAGIVLGQYAVHLASRNFPFVLGGTRVELSALRCERVSSNDGYGLPPEIPVHAYAIGERITGVDLVTDRIVFDGLAVDVDSAITIQTAHAAYTFARESWDSTDIRISMAHEPSIPSSVDEHNAEWLRAHPELGEATASRFITKLA